MNLIQDMYKDNFGFIQSILRLAYETVEEYQNLWLNMMKLAHSPSPAIERVCEEEQVEDIQRKSSRFLSALHLLSKGDKSRQLDIQDVAKGLRYSGSEIEYIAETLHRSELIKLDKSSNKVSITPYGIMVMNGEIEIGYAPIH